jgi:hypothetical protein
LKELEDAMMLAIPEEDVDDHDERREDADRQILHVVHHQRVEAPACLRDTYTKG